MEKLSTKELKELILFSCKFANAVDSAMIDGKFSIFDARHFVKLFDDSKNAFSGISTAIKELKDLDTKEKDELVLMVANELNLSVDVVEFMIEDIFDASLEMYLNLKKMLVLIKKKK